jgi:hypothetical protein
MKLLILLSSLAFAGLVLAQRPIGDHGPQDGDHEIQGGEHHDGDMQLGHGGHGEDSWRHHRHHRRHRHCRRHCYEPCRYYECPFPRPGPDCGGLLGCEKTLVHGCCSTLDYVIFFGAAESCKSEARAKCNCIGGSLADINTDNIMCISSALDGRSTPAYINSWNTDSYMDARIALYPNGAIAVPPGEDKHAFICQIPKLLLQDGGHWGHQNDEDDYDGHDGHGRFEGQEGHHRFGDDEDREEKAIDGMLFFSEGFDHSCCTFSQFKLSAANLKSLQAYKKKHNKTSAAVMAAVQENQESKQAEQQANQEKQQGQ